MNHVINLELFPSGSAASEARLKEETKVMNKSDERRTRLRELRMRRIIEAEEKNKSWREKLKTRTKSRKQARSPSKSKEKEGKVHEEKHPFEIVPNQDFLGDMELEHQSAKPSSFSKHGKAFRKMRALEKASLRSQGRKRAQSELLNHVQIPHLPKVQALVEIEIETMKEMAIREDFVDSMKLMMRELVMISTRSKFDENDSALQNLLREFEEKAFQLEESTEKVYQCVYEWKTCILEQEKLLGLETMPLLGYFTPFLEKMNSDVTEIYPETYCNEQNFESLQKVLEWASQFEFRRELESLQVEEESLFLQDEEEVWKPTTTKILKLSKKRLNCPSETKVDKNVILRLRGPGEDELQDFYDSDSEEEEYALLLGAAVKLQSFFRQCLACSTLQELRAGFARMKQAATNIQRIFRGYHVRIMQVVARKQRQKEIARMIHDRFSDPKKRTCARGEDIEDFAAVKIQSIARGAIIRKFFSAFQVLVTENRRI